MRLSTPRTIFPTPGERSDLWRSTSNGLFGLASLASLSGPLLCASAPIQGPGSGSSGRMSWHYSSPRSLLSGHGTWFTPDPSCPPCEPSTTCCAGSGVAASARTSGSGSIAPTTTAKSPNSASGGSGFSTATEAVHQRESSRGSSISHRRVANQDLRGCSDHPRDRLPLDPRIHRADRRTDARGCTG